VIVDQEQTVEKLELVWHHLYIEMIERGEAPAAEGSKGGVRASATIFESQLCGSSHPSPQDENLRNLSSLPPSSLHHITPPWSLAYIRL